MIHAPLKPYLFIPLLTLAAMVAGTQLGAGADGQ